MKMIIDSCIIYPFKITQWKKKRNYLFSDVIIRDMRLFPIFFNFTQTLFIFGGGGEQRNL